MYMCLYLTLKYFYVYDFLNYLRNFNRFVIENNTNTMPLQANLYLLMIRFYYILQQK